MTQPENPISEIIPYNPNLPAKVSAAIEPQWESQSGGLQIKLAGAYLGCLVGASGWNAGFKDSHEEAVLDAGLVFVVSQSSGGGTYLSAKAVDGYTVEALNPEASSRRSMWIQAPEYRDDVLVDSDWGSLGADVQDWSSINFGNPGTRSGLVRVTGPDEDQRYYLMGAKFQGEPDNWRVAGALCEVTPNEQLELAMTPRRLTGAIIDPSILSTEVAKTKSVSIQTITALHTAFEHDTPNVRIMSADQSSADAAKTYADVTLALLLEVAQLRPDILDGTEVAVDELGRRAKLITNAPRNSSYLDRLASDEENRVAYLTAVHDELSGYSATSHNAHGFTFFTKQAVAILEQGLAGGTPIELSEDSPVINMMHSLIAADQQQTAAIEARRIMTLENTIFNPEWSRDAVSYVAAIPGQKVVIDLNTITPLLSSEQTGAAFFTVERTDSDSIANQRYTTPTIAIVEFNKTRYAITEASIYHYSRTDSTSIKREFSLLRIIDGVKDPRYGLEVEASTFGFGSIYDTRIQVLFDPRKSGKTGYLGEIDAPITLEYDDETKTLVIHSSYMKAGVIASKDAVKAVAWQAEDTFSLEQRREIRDWQKEVIAVEKEIGAVRARLEENVADQIADGLATAAHLERSRSLIEEIVSRGAARSHTYNGYRGDKWHRAQTYYVTVDEAGNVWGEFEQVRSESGITGRPIAPGKRIIRHNPTRDK